MRNHSSKIYAICRRMMPTEEDAADAMQEAMIAVTRGINRFSGSSRFSTWCYRVTANACLDELRRTKRRPTPIDRSESFEQEAARSPESEVSASIDVRNALAAVSEDFRVAVVLRDVADLDYEEIAATLNVPIGTVRSRIARGRAALLAEIEREPGTRGRSSNE